MPQDFKEDLTREDLMFEHIFLALRTYRGICLEEFRNKFALPFENMYKSEIHILKQEKLAKIRQWLF